MNDLKKRRHIYELGQRALDYYSDTGNCVFCDADDCEFIPHDDDCPVGELTGIEQTEARAKEKKSQRIAIFEFLTTKP